MFRAVGVVAGLVLLAALVSAPGRSYAPLVPEGWTQQLAAATQARYVAHAEEAVTEHLLNAGTRVVVESLAREPLYSAGSGVVVPASLTKLLTAVAALHVLGPDYEFDSDAFAAELARQRVIENQYVPFVLAAAEELVASGPTLTLEQVLRHTLQNSDNSAAQLVAEELAVASGQPRTRAGAVAATEAALADLGIPLDGLELYDASGLDERDRIDPETLMAVLRLIRRPDPSTGSGTGVSLVYDLLPVAGESGTLAGRHLDPDDPAKGVARAKTGSLDVGVYGLAGYTTDADGGELAYIAVFDSPDVDERMARLQLDAIVTNLTRCHCGP